jgi:hypothetical protein
MKYKVSKADYELHNKVTELPFLRVVISSSDVAKLKRAKFSDYPDVGAKDAKTGLPVKRLTFVVGVEDVDDDHFLVDTRSVDTSDPNWTPT